MTEPIVWEITEQEFERLKDQAMYTSRRNASMRLSYSSSFTFQVCWTPQGVRFDLLKYWGSSGFITSFHEPSDFEGVRDAIMEAARNDMVEAVLAT